MVFEFSPIWPKQKDNTSYRLLSKEGVTVKKWQGEEFLLIEAHVLKTLAKEAFYDLAFFLRKSHLVSLQAILKDSEASDNDRFVAETMLKNSVIASYGQLPTCQDTGTALIMGKKGQEVLVSNKGDKALPLNSAQIDEEALSFGVYETYQEQNLRYSQLAAQSMFEEKNTNNNLPAQIDILATEGSAYEFLFVAKGGGSADKSYLYQESKAVLNEASLIKFLKEKLKSIGTSACPPYHLAIVIGGTSAEATLKAVKLASCKYLDDLPKTANGLGAAYRDLEWEKRVEQITKEIGIGAQFGGKYFAHDVRVIRLPRHAASCPIGIAVSCSADRNIKAKITKDGAFLEELEKNPAQFLPKTSGAIGAPINVNLDAPMAEILALLSKHPVATRLSLNGTLIVARDIAHAKIKKMIDEGKGMPQYFKDHPVYYAGPAKTPKGYASGSFGPTTAGRMDSYVEEFMQHGGSMIMLAKGNRSKAVKEACLEHGGFYLGSIGGPAAILAKENIESVSVVDFEELGMEAVRKIKVKDFPAFIICDDKGNDFFEML